MNPEETQDPSVNNDDITPEEAKASLGLANRLSEGFLMSQVPPEMQQDAPGQDVSQETQEGAPNEEPALKQEEVEKLIEERVSEAVKEELAVFKKELQDALKDDNEEDED